jgi:K+-sensing histidine kinase KdpD
LISLQVSLWSIGVRDRRGSVVSLRAMINGTNAWVAQRPSRRGVLVGVSSLLVISVSIYPFRHLDYELQFLLVLPVVYAGVLAGRTSALVTALAAVVAFHVVTRFGSRVEEDAIALVTFLGSALAVGAAVGSGTDRLTLAAQREEEQRRLRELNEQVATHAGRMAVLEQVDQQRVALLRSVSHDLRTPLATIRAVTTDLRDRDLHDEDTRQELLASVSDEAERLDRLVGNLLSMSRIEAGSLHVDDQVVDVAELVELTALRVGPLFTQVVVDVQIDPALPLIDGDPALLDEVISNLLENAARYAPPGSTVSVELACADGPAVVLRVQDHGPGVPIEHRDEVFQAFWRGPESRSSGLGLAIVRAVVEAHCGSIALSETPGGGATFDVVLPARQDDVL